MVREFIGRMTGRNPGAVIHIDLIGELEKAYLAGRRDATNDFLAYGSGLQSIVHLYGKAHTQKLLDAISDNRTIN